MLNLVKMKDPPPQVFDWAGKNMFSLWKLGHNNELKIVVMEKHTE